MLYSVENEHFRITVKSKGAELASLYHKKNNKEYLWQGDPSVFPRQANNLFPVVGAVVDDYIVIDGKKYEMKQHGFARDNEYELFEETDNTITLMLDGTKNNEQGELRFSKFFPFAFKFYISFTVDNDSVKQTYRVENCGNKEMQCSFGAHTGFFCPITLGEKTEDYVLDFGKDNGEITELLRIGTNSHRSGERTKMILPDGEFALTDKVFEGGAYILTDFKKNECRLVSKKSGEYVKVQFEGYPYCTVWSPVGEVKFVCIEPWCGLPDVMSTDHDFMKKEGNVKVAAGDSFARTQTFTVGK